MKKSKILTNSYFYLKFIFMLILLSFAVISIYITIYTNQKINDAKSIDIILQASNSSSKVYDSSGTLITELGLEKRDIVTFDEISPNLIHAVVATEDAKFFKHTGIDLKRVIAATKENIISKSYSQGASTITQQIVKNTFLTSEKNIDRKIKEAYLALELEKKYSKEEIITSYLNTILFSGRIYGIERASNYFFSKNATDLTLAEAATLAGMIQMPNAYNPVHYPEASNKRKNLVLDLMFRHGYITENEKETAKSIHTNELLKIEEETPSNNINSYIDFVIEELQTKYNINPFISGVDVYTTIDLKAQNHMDKIMNGEILEFPDNVVQTGIIFLENKTGKIKAIGGGRDNDKSLSFNYATEIRRQPGSTIKPILDYAPAFENYNYSTATPILDEALTYNDEFQTPIRNWDMQYKGWMSLRESLIESRNVPAVKLFREVGSSKALEMAKNLGLNVDEKLYEAAALGGFTYGFTVLDIANAYATFANNGVYVEATSIEKIVDSNNDEIPLIQNSNKAMSESTAFMINDILHENMLVGASKVVNINNGYYAGKTGQSNYDKTTTDKYNMPENTTNDSWFVGYSNEFTCAVWLGYPQIQYGEYLDNEEKKLSWHLWHEVMSKLDPQKNIPFPKPSNVVEASVEIYGDKILLPSNNTPNSLIHKEYFLAGTVPTEVSTNWTHLDKLNYFSEKYNFTTEKINFTFMPLNQQYTNEQLEIMKIVHSLDKEYQEAIIGLRKDYLNFTRKYSDYTYIPSMLFNSKWINRFEDYEKDNTVYNSRYSTSTLNVLIHNGIYDYTKLYQSSSNFLKPEILLTDISLETYEKLFVKLYEYEASKILNNNKLSLTTLLSLKEIENYKNNLNNESESQNITLENEYRINKYLGDYLYKIYGVTNGSKKLLATTKEPSIEIFLSSKDYLSYNCFEIVADYEKYPNHLMSEPLIIYPTKIIN